MAALTMPVKIEDHIIEQAAAEYRRKCGRNDVLVHNGHLIPFASYLAGHLFLLEQDPSRHTNWSLGR